MDPFSQPFRALVHETVEAAVERAVSRLAPRLTSAHRDRPAKGWLTTREVQAYLGLSKATVARMRADGRLPYSKVGQSVYVKREDVEALLERNAVGREGALTTD